MPGTLPILVLTLLCVCVAVADGLTRLPLGRQLGAPALSLLLAAVLANLGVLPGGSQLPPLYAHVFLVVAPMAIFYLLLDTQPRQFLLGAPAMLLAFAIGVLGTFAGVVLALHLTHFGEHFGDPGRQLAASFVAGFVGSGAEFDEAAHRFQVSPALYASGLSINALVASAWLLLCCLLPPVLQALPRYRHGAWIAGPAHQRHAQAQSARSTEQLASLGAFALLLALGTAAFGLSEFAAGWLQQRGLPLPSILLIGVFALLLAPTGLPAQLPGSRALGRFGVCLFLAVLGAHAELSLLPLLGAQGPVLLAFVGVLLAVHLLVLIMAGLWLRIDPDVVAIASQAGIGGASTAMAVAESRQRHGLAMPAILAGSLGNALGVGAGLLALRLLGG